MSFSCFFITFLNKKNRNWNRNYKQNLKIRNFFQISYVQHNTFSKLNYTGLRSSNIELGIAFGGLFFKVIGILWLFLHRDISFIHESISGNIQIFFFYHHGRSAIEIRVALSILINISISVSCGGGNMICGRTSAYCNGIFIKNLCVLIR